MLRLRASDVRMAGVHTSARTPVSTARETSRSIWRGVRVQMFDLSGGRLVSAERATFQVFSSSKSLNFGRFGVWL